MMLILVFLHLKPGAVPLFLLKERLESEGESEV
jgi:hypothetical protein